MDDRVTAWYEAYAQELLRFIALHMSGHPDAEDVCAQVFFEAWRCRDRIDDTPRPWLYTVARCRIIDWRRRRNIRTGFPIESIAPIDDSFEDRVIDHVDVAQAWSEDRRITDAQRRAIWHVYVEGRSNEEAAQWMGLSYAALKALLHRGKVNLSQNPHLRYTQP